VVCIPQHSARTFFLSRSTCPLGQQVNQHYLRAECHCSSSVRLGIVPLPASFVGIILCAEIILSRENQPMDPLVLINAGTITQFFLRVGVSPSLITASLHVAKPGLRTERRIATGLTQSRDFT